MKYEYYVLATWKDPKTGIMVTDLSCPTTSHDGALAWIEHIYNRIDWNLDYADEVCVNGRLYGFEHEGIRYSVAYVPEV